jgi:hypothetical protein
MSIFWHGVQVQRIDVASSKDGQDLEWRVVRYGQFLKTFVLCYFSEETILLELATFCCVTYVRMSNTTVTQLF